MENIFLKLKRNSRSKALKGHPWVYSSDVQSMPSEEHDGECIQLVDMTGRHQGMGIFNSQSQIVWRRLSRGKMVFDASFLKEAIAKAIALRSGTGDYCRVVWSEADGLPGLVVDRFNDVLVVQIGTLAMEKRMELIGDILKELLTPREIVFRNDAPNREHEGLTLYTATQSKCDLEPEWHTIDGVEYWLDLQNGQKTGFYLDQRPQHKRIAEFAEGRDVFDGCCNQGAFALHCAKAGAKSVTALDISEDCIAATEKNAEKNGVEVKAIAANLFDWFRKNRNNRYDLIILDPPSFARNKKAVEGAMRGYKELNIRALKMLNPGGILATYSCSQNVTLPLFLQSIQEAAGDVMRDVRLLEMVSQPLDHPVIFSMPESNYLKGAIVEAGPLAVYK